MKEISLFSSYPGCEQSADAKIPANKLDKVWDERAYKACGFMQRHIADHPALKDDRRVSLDNLADLVRDHLEYIRADFLKGVKDGTVSSAGDRYAYAKNVVYWHGLLKLLRKMAVDWDNPAMEFCADEDVPDDVAGSERLPEPGADDPSNDHEVEHGSDDANLEDIIRMERSILCEGIRRHPEKLDDATITLREAADWMRYVMLILLERYGKDDREHSEDGCITLARNLLIADAVADLLDITAIKEGDAYIHLCDLGCAAVRHREQRGKE